MPGVCFQAIDVKTDTGSQEGCLALVDGMLVAVFVRVRQNETLNGEKACEGWFREIGFGPCSDLIASRPGIFASLSEAARWVDERLGVRL